MRILLHQYDKGSAYGTEQASSYAASVSLRNASILEHPACLKLNCFAPVVPLSPPNRPASGRFAGQKDGWRSCLLPST